jgi:hypothetical protein
LGQVVIHEDTGEMLKVYCTTASKIETFNITRKSSFAEIYCHVESLAELPEKNDK